MDWLTDNLVANMHGPEFLMFYATVCGVTLIACWFLLRSPTSSIDLSTSREETTKSIQRIQAGGTVVIVGLATYKLLVALSRGRHNVLYLLAICAVSVGLLHWLCSSRTTIPPGSS